MKNTSLAIIVCLLAFFATALPAHAASASATYGYDALGRLVTVTYNNGTVITYTYDTAGNRIKQTVTCPASGC